MVEKQYFFKMLDMLDSVKKPYYIDGGYGVDILYGKLTRWHRDVDVDFDSKDLDLFVETIKNNGYELTRDLMPIEAEYTHKVYGTINIHPFSFKDGMRPISKEGGVWTFDDSYFTKATFEDRSIPCISIEGQIAFHKGYLQRDVDEADVSLLLQMQANRN